MKHSSKNQKEITSSSEISDKLCLEKYANYLRVVAENFTNKRNSLAVIYIYKYKFLVHDKDLKRLSGSPEC